MRSQGQALILRCNRTAATTPLSPAARYHPVSIALHWLLALMILASLGVGLYMTGLPFSPTRLKLYNWHKWAGVLILALSAARLLRRLTHRSPADLPMPAWQNRAAHAAHLALHGLFFAVPLAAWAYSSRPGSPSCCLLFCRCPTGCP